MITTIEPSALSGAILAPASKSSMQRACAAALLRAGETVIRHPGYSNDDKAALGVIKDLGAEVSELADGALRVKSQGVAPSGELEVNCGESGLGLRMFAPIIALSEKAIRVKGEGSLLKRPMDFFDEVFPQLGIRVVSNGGKLPLEIQGPLQPRDIEIDGSLSSQFLTGLLFAFAAAGAGERGVAIRVRDLKSKPYIDLTLQVMKHFGWEVENRGYAEFRFPAERRTGEPEYTVEGDWSGGAFLLVAGAVAGPIVVRGLDEWSTQADKAILQALCDSGATLEMRGEEMLVGPVDGAASGPARAGLKAGGAGPVGLRAFTFDATDCPDLFPPLVALAAYCEGVTVIKGVSRLAHKESNRGLTLQEEFGKMGVRIELDGDLMRVHGGQGVKGATVHSRHDHRIAMACAVAALKASGPVTIEDAEAIEKSYPDFYRHVAQLGGKVNIEL
ncbi:3-phosphoshikimate 1-carboxyvinyltransferase [Puia dinghuensis]|uniref:3-phosphoshikimate 1-carboxyvinyltransferase n=1 Tax=Puia dinghuensis TaxID=1792502 RepID=A0A8J2XS11_9BACT|nr:3-phosphoshikimate 1-carboxyvinyltransferase [Puia dinghuensis]GGA91500.1 3-phosphoshikimate 1-carboxyvinyltransferase [Puia dinghuensis]